MIPSQRVPGLPDKPSFNSTEDLVCLDCEAAYVRVRWRIVHVQVRGYPSN